MKIILDPVGIGNKITRWDFIAQDKKNTFIVSVYHAYEAEQVKIALKR